MPHRLRPGIADWFEAGICPRARCWPCSWPGLKGAGTLRPEQVSVGKLNNVREAIAIARECRTILGGAGITLVIGQALTELSAYR